MLRIGKHFLANRVVAFQTEAQFANWNYVLTRENPADLASSGILAPEFSESKLWWQCPSWMSRTEDLRPKNRNFYKLETDVDYYVRVHHAHDRDKFCLNNLVNGISSWSKAVHILTYVLKYLDI